MGAPYYEDETTPTDVPFVRSSPTYVNTISGVNQSGADAWLQLWPVSTNPPTGAALYSIPAADGQLVSMALPGFNERVPGRYIATGICVGWSSSPDTWVPVAGSRNIAGQDT